MSRFLLLLRDDPSTFSSLSPDEMQAIIQKYVAWGDRLRADGRLVASDKLRDGEGRVVWGGASGAVSTDGPFVESKEVVGGFYILRAKDYDEAVRLVADAPHLAFGSIEIRQVEDLG